MRTRFFYFFQQKFKSSFKVGNFQVFSELSQYFQLDKILSYLHSCPTTNDTNTTGTNFSFVRLWFFPWDTSDKIFVQPDKSTDFNSLLYFLFHFLENAVVRLVSNHRCCEDRSRKYRYSLRTFSSSFRSIPLNQSKRYAFRLMKTFEL